MEERTASAVLGSVFSDVSGASGNIRPKSNADIWQQNCVVDVRSDSIANLVVLALLSRIDHSVVTNSSRRVWLWSRGDSGCGSGCGCGDGCEG